MIVIFLGNKSGVISSVGRASHHTVIIISDGPASCYLLLWNWEHGREKHKASLFWSTWLSVFLTNEIKY